MTEQHFHVIRAGNRCCLSFERIGDSALRTLRKEFGNQHIIATDVVEEPLVRTVFEKVVLPPLSEGVGRDARYTQNEVYLQTGDGWATFPIGALLERNIEFVVKCTPNVNILRLTAYILEPLMRVRALLEGEVFVHSSSVVVKGKAILLSAWGNTGKTNLALQLSDEEDSFLLSDDWTLIHRDGRISSFPRPLNLMNYNSDLFPERVRKFPWTKRFLTFADRLYRGVFSRFGRTGGLSQVYRVLERAFEMLSTTHVPLEFSPAQDRTHVPCLFCNVLKCEASGTLDRATSIREFATRAAACFAYENVRLFDRIQEFEFANSCSESNLRSQIHLLHVENVTNILDSRSEVPIVDVPVTTSPTREDIRELAKRILDLQF